MKRLLCILLGHDLEYTEEVIDRLFLRVEFGRCVRCEEVSFVSDIHEA